MNIFEDETYFLSLDGVIVRRNLTRLEAERIAQDGYERLGVIYTIHPSWMAKYYT